jgi:hypothetical protein
MGGGNLEGDYFVGPKAEQYRGLLKIRYPVEHGVVTNWDDMEKIWNYIYTEDLKAHPEEVHKQKKRDGKCTFNQILSYSILFYFILFYFILFYFILF